MKTWCNYNVTSNCAATAEPASRLLAGPQPDQGEQKGALSGADVQWEARESWSSEWSRCHLDIHRLIPTTTSSSFDTLLLAGDGESIPQKGSMFILFRSLLLPGRCCWALHICSLLSKWHSWMQGRESCICRGNLRVRRPQSIRVIRVNNSVLTFLPSPNRNIS